jgi:PilZ domain
MESPGERRRNPRLGMAIAVHVQGFRVGGATWDEVTQTDDVSAGGASVIIKHSVELGQVLHLTLAMPKTLRQYDLSESTYRVYSLVRGISRRPEGDSRVGLMFFGQAPPRGFQDRPWARFLLPSDTAAMNAAKRTGAGSPDDTNPGAASGGGSASGAGSTTGTSQAFAAGQRQAQDAPPTTPADPNERRAHPRFQLFVNFTIQQVDEWGAVLQEELTVAESLSKGGAQVKTSLGFMTGDVILLQEAGGGYATRAEVRGVETGPDGIARLHLKFLDRPAPERLLKA